MYMYNNMYNIMYLTSKKNIESQVTQPDKIEISLIQYLLALTAIQYNYKPTANESVKTHTEQTEHWTMSLVRRAIQSLQCCTAVMPLLCHNLQVDMIFSGSCHGLAWVHWHCRGYLEWSYYVVPAMRGGVGERVCSWGYRWTTYMYGRVNKHPSIA